MVKKQTHVAYGLVTGVVMVVIMLVNYLTGIAFKPGMQYFSYIPFIIGMILNANAYSKANDGYVTFGNVFGSCFKGTMIVALVLVAWSIVSIFALPEMKEKAFAIAREKLMEDKHITDEQIEMSLNFMKKGYTTILISASLFGTLAAGALFSVIAAAVAKKKGELPITSDNF